MSVAVAAAAAASPAVSVSFVTRLAYDDNLYLQNAAAPTIGAAAPPLPGVTSDAVFDARATIFFRAARGAESTVEASYAADVFRFDRHASENHVDHIATVGATGTRGNWSGELKARYLFTDGSREAPTYNCLGGSPAIGGEPIRSRREQTVLRANGRLTRRFEGGFARGLVTLLDQDFRTEQRSLTGYANYVDRSELAAGGDVGWRRGNNRALVAGFRIGRQRQADVLGVPLNFSNTYRRLLFGFEGSLAPRWKANFLVGPDVRQFGNSVRPGFVRDVRTGYAEGNTVWTPTRRDTLTSTGKYAVWLSSVGRGAYADSVVDLSWRRALAPAWTLTSSANFHDGAFRRYNPAAPRHDRIYTASANLGHVLARRTRVELEVAHERGATLVPNTPSREYHRWVTSLSATRDW